MRIYYITPYSLRMVSGVSKVVTDLCKGLKKFDIDALVLSGRSVDEIEKDNAVEAVEIDVSRYSNFKDFFLASKIIRILLKNRMDYDIIHLQTPHLPPMLSAITARILGKPVIATIHGKFPRPNGLIKRFYQWVTIKGTIAFSNKLTFVDREARDHYDVPSGEVIENGIDVNFYSPDKNVRSHTRKELGISEDEIMFLYLGRLVAHKGIYDLLNAFSDHIRTNNIGVKLIVIGSGEFSKVKDKIFVLYTSPLEGLPITLLEASSCGLAIISTNVSGIPNLIKNEKNGLLLEYGDKKGLVQAISRISKDSELKESLAKNARAEVVERYDIDKTVEKYVNLYRSVLET
jgi:glycosyltransferase involved in cell wall biosynthesis